MWVHADDAAKVHGVTPRHLRRVAAEMRWRVLKVGRWVHYHHADLESWQDTRTGGA